MNDDDKRHAEQDWLPDLAEFARNAPSVRQLAWKALKDTRNPEYVAARYGFPVENMRAALEKIPESDAGTSHAIGARCRAASRRGRQSDSTAGNAGQAVRGSSVDREPSREPGSDDDQE